MESLYIHIPFCASRCIYCGFYSTTASGLKDSYVDAVCREMELRKHEVEGRAISTVYLGGGTPSQLSAYNLRRLFDGVYRTYDVDADAEITMECNPDDVTPAFCSVLKQLPVNRVSMGAQTFSDLRLRFLHRRHTAAEVSVAVSRLRGIGIGNISIDLMFGFPNETLAEWQDDIDKALSLEVEHMSAYSLQYEEGTPLYRMLQQGRVREVDDELYRSMFDVLCDALDAHGYEHYEISNFARHGFRSRHNSSYWHDVPYIGLGAAAHSYTGTERSWNVSDLRRYISSIEQGTLPSASETIDPDTHYDDTVMTALRTREGITFDTLEPKYRDYLLGSARRYIDDGELELSDGRLSLTRKGIYISDMIMSDLMIG